MNDLEKIPGIGPRLASSLRNLGFSRVEDLRDRDPEHMYGELCGLRRTHIDRCVLYAFRCAVYFASNSVHNPELLKWWNWKEKR